MISVSSKFNNNTDDNDDDDEGHGGDEGEIRCGNNNSNLQITFSILL